MTTSNAYLFSKDFALWGKLQPFLSLPGHMISTGIISQQLLLHGSFYCALPVLSDALGLSDNETIAFAGFFASVHDIGKCHPNFLSKRPEDQEYFSSHHMISMIDIRGSYFSHAQYTCSILKESWVKHGWKQRLLDVLPFHHQRKNNGNSQSYLCAGKPLKPQQDALQDLCLRFFQPPESFSPKDYSVACEILLGLVIVSDWIASGSELVEKLQPLDSDATFLSMKSFLEQEYMPASLRENHMDYAPLTKVYLSFSAFFPHLPAPRPIQSGIDELFSCHSPKSLRALCIEAPMGEGKTEASLYAAYQMAQAWGKDGIFFALPTMATSNQMRERLRKVLLAHGRDEGTQLIHSMSKFLPMPDTSEEDHSLFTASIRRQLLSHFGVGTIDQVLMAVLAGSCYGVVRFAGLLSKVLVFDELHSYDAYMQKLICVLLHWCRVLHIPVIMLSATLRQEQKDSFFQSLGCHESGSQSSYPLFTAISVDGARIEEPVSSAQSPRNIPLHFVEKKDIYSAIDAFHDAFSKAGGKGCFCLLQNTVKEAQDLYLALKEDPCIPSDNLRLLHSRLLLRNRRAVEEEVTHLLGRDGSSSRPECFILVSTQIVEQSLDLDFDVLISDIAPIDLVFQRIGRLWRHERSWRPCSTPLMYLLTRDTYPKKGAYFPVYLQETEKILRQLSTVRIPDQIPELIRQVYHVQRIEDLTQEENAEVLSIGEPDADTFYLISPSSMFCENEEDSFFKLPAPTRDAPSSERACFLPPFLWEKVHDKRVEDMELAREVIGYSINVPSYIDTQNLGEPGRGLLHGFHLYLTEDDDRLPFKPSVEISSSVGLYVV